MVFERRRRRSGVRRTGDWARAGGLGFERARQEGVGTSCIAASDRDRFYKACGFDVQCGIAGDEGPDHELRTTLRNIGGGTIHFWDGGMEPEGVREYGEE